MKQKLINLGTSAIDFLIGIVTKTFLIVDNSLTTLAEFAKSPTKIIWIGVVTDFVFNNAGVTTVIVTESTKILGQVIAMLSTGGTTLVIAAIVVYLFTKMK